MSKAPRQAPSHRRDQREQHAAPSVRPARDALVFLVDDDEAVRDAIATSLRSAGFAVASFGSARQFLDAYRAGQHGCLVVDVDLPGVEPELLRILASSELPLPVIITSRRLRRRALAPSVSAIAAVLLEKPFGVEELLPLLRAALSSGNELTGQDSGIPRT